SPLRAARRFPSAATVEHGRTSAGAKTRARIRDHEEYARHCAIDIPGPETDRLGELVAQAKARHEEFPGRYFNVGVVIDPQGEVILRHHKVVPLLPVEHSMTPHNVWDRWVELYGMTLDAFYPVVDTEIGRLGIMMANEG